MKRKVKRYDDGGEVIDLRDDTSQPTGIDDDVRARARRFLETGKKDSDEESEPVRAKAKPKLAKPKEPATLNFSEEKARLEKIDKPLEESHPEDYIPGFGMLKGVARSAISSAAKDTAKKTMRENALKGEEKYNQQIRNLAAEKTKKDAAKLSEKSERIQSSGGFKSDFKPEEMRAGYKKGGMVASRGDGIAQRGKTKGRLR